MVLQAPKGLCLASSDDFTRQRCMRIIQAASAGGASSSLCDIASAAALTPDLLNMKSVSAIKAVLSALGIAWNDPCLKAAGFDLLSLKTPGFELAAFRAAGCSWADIRAAGFTAADVSAAGCDLATAKTAGYDVCSLVSGFGLDAVVDSGVDLNGCMLVSRANARACWLLASSFTLAPSEALTPPPARRIKRVYDAASSQSR